MTDRPLDIDPHSPPARLQGLARSAAQTWALTVDAYRDLNSRALFWIAIGLSGLVALAFAAVGYGPEGIFIFGRHASNFPNSNLVPTGDFYKDLFISFGLTYWITWAATILALISTAGIFPDLISGGSIDLYLSKPLGRLRLFLTKYVVGLMFVALQITVFCLASFLVIGFRGGVWAPSIFLAIPVVTLYFSFLFCVAVLVGTITGSTLSSILITLLFWFLLFIVNVTDGALLGFKTLYEVDAQGYHARMERRQAQIDRWEANPDVAPGQIIQQGMRDALVADRTAFEEQQATARQLDSWHRLILNTKAPLPKTQESIDILRRWLIESEELAPTAPARINEPLTDHGVAPPALTDEAAPAAEPAPQRRRRARGENPGELMANPAVQQNIQAAQLQRGVFWAFGTSLLFEAVVLAIAAWSFVRRDF